MAKLSAKIMGGFCLAILATTTAPLLAAQQTGAPAVAVKKSHFDELRRRGFEANFNLDYEAARRFFEELARKYPEDPAGPLFLATNVWLKTLSETRRLQSSLYNSDSFYTDSEEKADPRVLAQFREHVRLAKELVDARLKSDPKNVEALYMLGAIDGVKAAFTASVERKFIGALRDGSSSVDRHREVLKLDPNYIDAELTLGLYDYVVGDLPLPIKMLASLGGVRGSKRRGVERLERVARDSPWSGDNAKMVLMAIRKREERFDAAYQLADELARKYPRNYLFKVEAADALFAHAASQEAINPEKAAAARRAAAAAFDALLRDQGVRRVAPSLDLIHFRYGEALWAAGMFDQASAQFLLGASAVKAQEQLVTLSRLRAAQSLDLAGQRSAALAQYRIVAGRPNVYDSRSAAERGIREQYKLTSSNK